MSLKRILFPLRGFSLALVVKLRFGKEVVECYLTMLEWRLGVVLLRAHFGAGFGIALALGRCLHLVMACEAVPLDRAELDDGLVIASHCCHIQSDGTIPDLSNLATLHYLFGRINAVSRGKSLRHTRLQV